MISLPRSPRVFSSPLFKLPLLLALAACACSMPLAQAAGETPGQAVHPVIGTWSWAGFSGKCVETLQYRPNGTLLSTSGDAVTEWKYDITPNTTEKGFYKVVETSLRQNGKRDCAGDLMERDGDINTRYLQLSPARDRMIICQTESLSACFGPMAKIE